MADFDTTEDQVIENVEERRITLRVPEILALRIEGDVRKHKTDNPGFSMNTWLVEAARARIDGGSASKPIGSIPKLHASDFVPSDPKVGFGKDPLAYLKQKALPVTPLVTEEAEPKWLPRLRKFAASYSIDPGQPNEDLMTAMGGKQPPQFARWAADKKVMWRLARWLDEHFPEEQF